MIFKMYTKMISDIEYQFRPGIWCKKQYADDLEKLLPNLQNPIPKNDKYDRHCHCIQFYWAPTNNTISMH